MPDLEIYFNKSVEENAGIYFEKAKKIRKKLTGAKKALEESRKKLEEIEKKELKLKKEKKEIKKRKKEWYEKFRWFVSSDNDLVIGGRDATSNEILIKKHAQPEEIVFHTEIAGSPFVVIKENKNPSSQAIKEAAIFCASHSQAWGRKLGWTEVYWVKGHQVSKKAPSGEYLAKGAFIISGKRNYLKVELELAIGINKERLMIGPVMAIEKNCSSFVKIKPGYTKKSDLAKKIKFLLEKKSGLQLDLDEIMQLLPAGEGEIVS